MKVADITQKILGPSGDPWPDGSLLFAIGVDKIGVLAEGGLFLITVTPAVLTPQVKTTVNYPNPLGGPQWTGQHRGQA